MFAAGYLTCLMTRHTPSAAETAAMLAQPGDAPAGVRTGVVATLAALAAGYGTQDSSRLDAVMNQVFATDADLLVLGADGYGHEWARGREQARKFLTRDWAVWGDFRFDPAKTLVWSSGNVAWIATVGQVRYPHGNRQIRLTGVLEKRDGPLRNGPQLGGQWVIRQLQFQWADGAATARDLIHGATYSELLHKGWPHWKR